MSASRLVGSRVRSSFRAHGLPAGVGARFLERAAGSLTVRVTTRSSVRPRQLPCSDPRQARRQSRLAQGRPSARPAGRRALLAVRSAGRLLGGGSGSADIAVRTGDALDAACGAGAGAYPDVGVCRPVQRRDRRLGVARARVGHIRSEPLRAARPERSGRLSLSDDELLHRGPVRRPKPDLQRGQRPDRPVRAGELVAAPTGLQRLQHRLTSPTTAAAISSTSPAPRSSAGSRTTSGSATTRTTR